MRAAPACQFSLQRFGVWRGAVLVLAALDVATVAAWLITRESALPWPATIAAAVAALALAALGASLVRAPRVDLRWDGGVWHLGPASGETLAGALNVAIDLGPWMLLRFSPAPPHGQNRPVWLPVQRRGLEGQWHALRCAVYSPRPAPSADAPVAR